MSSLTKPVPRRFALSFFQRALQRVSVLAGEVHHLIHFGFGDFVREHAAHPDAFLVDVEHHPGCLFQVHLEKPLEHHDHEFHRGVIVVEQQHLELAWFFGLGPGFGGNAKLVLAISVTAFALTVAGIVAGTKAGLRASRAQGIRGQGSRNQHRSKISYHLGKGQGLFVSLARKILAT